MMRAVLMLLMMALAAAPGSTAAECRWKVKEETAVARPRTDTWKRMKP